MTPPHAYTPHRDHRERDETWKPIADFPDYEASSYGQIRRCKPNLRGQPLSGKPLKATLLPSGYLQVTLYKNAKSTNVRVNRIVCIAFHGEPADKALHAAHCDGNSVNNRADNLRWAYPEENEADKRLHGTARIGERHWVKSKPERCVRGSRHPGAKLTESDVSLIRKDTRARSAIAADYGVARVTIWGIQLGKRWSHVE